MLGNKTFGQYVNIRKCWFGCLQSPLCVTFGVPWHNDVQRHLLNSSTVRFSGFSNFLRFVVGALTWQLVLLPVDAILIEVT